MRDRLRSACKWGATVLTVLFIALWIGSSRLSFGVFWLPTIQFEILHGRLLLGWEEPWSLTPSAYRWSGIKGIQHAAVALWFEGGRGTMKNGVTFTFAYVPIWVFVLVAFIPAAWLWRRDRNRRPWICPRCQYDLRAATYRVCVDCGGEFIVCPECGTKRWKHSSHLATEPPSRNSPASFGGTQEKKPG